MKKAIFKNLDGSEICHRIEEDPTAWGTADPQLQIGPFPVSLAYTGTITNFTNQSGYSQDYYVYRSDNLLFDSSVVVTVL